MRRIITFIILGVTCYAHAQNKGRVGINTSTPRATLDVSRVDPTTLPAGQAQGVSIPNMTSAERSAFVGVEHGTLIYNTDKKCTEMYEINGGNGEWHCLPAVGSVHTQTVSVIASGFEGNFFTGGVMPNNKVKFTIYNSTPVPMTAVDFSNSITVQNPYLGTLQVQPGQNTAVNIPAGGSYVLYYTFTGTPAQGTLKATFNYGRLNASQSVEIRKSPEIENVNRYVASMVYFTQNIKGEINNTKKLTVKIPWKNGEGPFEAVSVTKQTNVGAGLGGDINNLTLDIPAGDFGTTGWESGEITATITVDGDGVYKVDQKTNTEWDIAVFPITLNGKSFNVLLKGVSGIPDRCFNKTNKECAGGHAWLSNDYDHQFVYMPITGPDGKIWLNNVLGAGYSNVEGPYASPLQIPTSYDDYKGYGSLFQHNRKADGHEIITYKGVGSGDGILKYGHIYLEDLIANGVNPTSLNAKTDKHIGRRVEGIGVQNYWNNDATYINYWKKGGVSNPCPVGYHLPSISELTNFVHTTCNVTHVNSGYTYPAEAITYPCSLSPSVKSFLKPQAYGRVWSYFYLSNGSIEYPYLIAADNRQYNNYYPGGYYFGYYYTTDAKGRKGWLTVAVNSSTYATRMPGFYAFSYKCIKD